MKSGATPPQQLQIVRVATIPASVPAEIWGGLLIVLGKGRGLAVNVPAVVALLDGKWTSVEEVLGLVVKAVGGSAGSVDYGKVPAKMDDLMLRVSDSGLTIYDAASGCGFGSGYSYSKASARTSGDTPSSRRKTFWST